MRHRRAGYRLGRTTAHRASTLRHLAAGLFEHGQIVTTIPRAKAVQPLV
jgi:large subunit ribosomal protein L17